jgi:hypothetical protein
VETTVSTEKGNGFVAPPTVSTGAVTPSTLLDERRTGSGGITRFSAWIVRFPPGTARA